MTFSMPKMDEQSGFTLIELLVVISIISLLSSIILVATVNVRKKARMSVRVSNMRQVQTALELYHEDNSADPTTAGYYSSECPGSLAGHEWWLPAGTPKLGTDVAPGLVPKYIASFPADPQMNKNNSQSCLIYRSDDGQQYSLLDHGILEYNDSDYMAFKDFVDPARDGGTDPCRVDPPLNPAVNTIWSMAVFVSKNPGCTPY